MKYIYIYIYIILYYVIYYRLLYIIDIWQDHLVNVPSAHAEKYWQWPICSIFFLGNRWKNSGSFNKVPGFEGVAVGILTVIRRWCQHSFSSQKKKERKKRWVGPKSM